MKPRNKIQPLPFVLPALIVYILTVIIPILWSIPVMCRTDPGDFAYTYFQGWKYSAGYLFYSMYHFIYGDLPDFFQNAFCPAPGSGLLCDGKTGNGTYRFAGKFPYSADNHNPDRWI